MNGYLLDTSICVYLFRGNRNVMQRLNEIGFERCFICDVVLAELRYGAYLSNYVEDNLRMIDDFIKAVRVLPFADSIDIYAKEKLRLKNAGTPIEDFDLLIGCAAKATGLTMVTHNIKHFNHIEELPVEDWII